MTLLKKLFAASLALILAAALLAACGGTDKPPAPNLNTSNGQGPGGTTENTYKFIDADGVERWKVQVDSFDWGGRNFNVLVRGDTTGVYRDIDFTVRDADAGEPINDAAYRRNLEIEEMFNIKITVLREANDNHLAKVRSSVQAGDGAYDITLNNMRHNGTLSREGLLCNLMDFPNIDLSEPWWDQNMIASTSVAGKIYAAAGDVSLSYRNCIIPILFNKQIITNLGLESPYKLVENNEWTFSKLAEMCKDVWDNLNEEGTPNPNSTIGLCGYTASLSFSLLGAEVILMGKDANDIPELTFYSERTVDVFDKITDFLYDRTLFYNSQAGYAGARNGRTKFLNEEVLFYWFEMNTVFELRQMDTDFGIIPVPKFDGLQSRYYIPSNFTEAMILAIPRPNNQEDIPYIGAVVSAMATLGKNYLTPAFYDVSLQGKVTRDEESGKMLDLIYNSTFYDLGRAYNIGGLANRFNDIHAGYIKNITSEYQSREAMMQSDLEKFIEDYLALDD